MARRRAARSNAPSAIVGGLLLALGCIWLGWLVIGQHGGLNLGFGAPHFSLPGFNAPTAVSETQIPPLAAEGITLGHFDQVPALGQKQALLLASQLEPDAATKAKTVVARYVSLTYTSTGTAHAHTNLSNVPVWLIVYQQIPLLPADASVDPTPFPHSYHDLYVFLNASSGKEVLSVWV